MDVFSVGLTIRLGTQLEGSTVLQMFFVTWQWIITLSPDWGEGAVVPCQLCVMCWWGGGQCGDTTHRGLYQEQGAQGEASNQPDSAGSLRNSEEQWRGRGQLCVMSVCA